MIYDIAVLKRKVTNIYPFFSSIAADIEYIETEAVEIIASSGKTIFYNPGYMAGISDDEQIFFLAHEICHIAFSHEERGAGKEQVMWDRAADAVINQMLKRDGFDIPVRAIDYPEAIDYDAEDFYEILLKEKMAVDLMYGQLEGQETPLGGNPEGRENTVGEDEDQEDYDENVMSSENDPELLDEDEESDEDQEEELVLVEKIESEAGNSVSPDTRNMDDIGNDIPAIDWRLLLIDSINYGVDWSYMNAVLEDGIVRPVLEELPIPETEIVLDTSWSVDEDLLRSFLRECKNILKFSKLRAGCFDTVFYGFHDIRSEKDIEEMEFHGGGGTDFNVAVDSFTMRADNRIIFTDGQAPVPDKYMKAIWIVYSDEQIQPKGGTVINII